MKKIILAAAAMLFATPAMADLVAQPIQTEGTTVRFEHGAATIEDDMKDAGVRVMPLARMDHGRLQFKVAVYNKSAVPVNVGVESMTLVHNNDKLPCLSAADLAKMAKKRAMWSQIGYAMLAGVAAAGQNNDTTITTYTPRGGVYRTVINRPGLSDGQIATIAAGGGAIALSQIGLQKTLEAIGEDVVQTTTIDPEMGYGGIVVARKMNKAKAGDLVGLNVLVGNVTHTFTFKLAKA